MASTTGYKLFSRRKDGTLGPLFINRSQRIVPGVEYASEDHPTKGFAHRPGWHATLVPVAPHLAMRPAKGGERVWCRVRLSGAMRTSSRPQSQGGTWILAEKLEVLEVMEGYSHEA